MQVSNGVSFIFMLKYHIMLIVSRDYLPSSSALYSDKNLG